jgi:hypothetical protein
LTKIIIKGKANNTIMAYLTMKVSGTETLVTKLKAVLSVDSKAEQSTMNRLFPSSFYPLALNNLLAAGANPSEVQGSQPPEASRTGGQAPPAGTPIQVWLRGEFVIGNGGVNNNNVMPFLILPAEYRPNGHTRRFPMDGMTLVIETNGHVYAEEPDDQYNLLYGRRVCLSGISYIR